jgi:hypothetical protein
MHVKFYVVVSASCFTLVCSKEQTWLRRKSWRLSFQHKADYPINVLIHVELPHAGRHKTKTIYVIVTAVILFCFYLLQFLSPVVFYNPLRSHSAKLALHVIHKNNVCSTMRPDYGGSKRLWNAGKLLPDYTAQQPKRQSSWSNLGFLKNWGYVGRMWMKFIWQFSM